MAIYRAVVTISNGILGGTGTNTWHLRTITGPTGLATANILMGHVHDFYENMNNYFHDDTVFNFNGEFSGVGESENTVITGDTWQANGTTTTWPLPPANTICVTWKGEAGDRSKNGRTFLGPIGSNCNDPQGTIDNTVLTAIRNEADTLVGHSLEDGNGALGIWSRQEQVLRDFSESHVSDKFAILRSRRD